MTTSTYNIYIATISNELFSGSFVVNNKTNIITEFYESGNNDSILVPTIVSSNIITNNFIYIDPRTNTQFPFKTFNDSDFLIPPYSNAYLPSWKCFPYNGVIIRPTTWLGANGNKIFLSNLIDADLINFSEGIARLQSSLTDISIVYEITPQLHCFNENTKILCLNNQFKEVYVPVQELKKGSIVKTFKHGYRKIENIGKGTFQNNPDRWDNCMYVLSKNSSMTEDLIITGGHSILVDKVSDEEEVEQKNYWPNGEAEKIDNKTLLLAAASKKFNKIQNNNVFTFYHFYLENDGIKKRRFGVWANGVLVDTPSKLEYDKHRYSN
jgi:hypothetical protein